MLKKISTLFTKEKSKKNPNTNKLANYASTLDQVFIRVQDLQIGMYVSELDRPWRETSFRFQGFLIQTEEELDAVKDVCDHVYIDISKQKKIRTETRRKPDSTDDKVLKITEPKEKLGSFEQEFERADNTFQHSKDLVTDFMSTVANGGSIDTTSATEAIADCVDSVMQSPDAFLWLSQLKKRDQYTAQHSMNVCILSIVLGRQIGLQAEQLNRVAMCGMMFDMGKMLVPLQILNKPGKLTPAETSIMEEHTVLGHNLLASSPNMFKGAIETALTHHERADGHGYPKGIRSNTLSYYSNIVAIADIYDAMTSDRVYQRASTHLEAIKVLFDLSGKQLNQQLVVKFIESLSIYPPGSFVKMSNGSIAMVLEINDQLKLRPKIILIMDHNREPLGDIVVDLTQTVTDFAGNALSISNIIKPHDYKISTRKYYNREMIMNGFAEFSPKKTGVFGRLRT